MAAYNLNQLDEFLKTIQMPTDAHTQCLLWAEKPELEAFKPLIEPLIHQSTAEQTEKKLRAECAKLDEKGIAELTMMLLAALETHKDYIAQAIPDEIFIDTMKCFSRFVCECKRWFHEVCFNRGFWAWRQLCGNLFRLGDLEFERTWVTDEAAKHLNVEPLTEAVSVHIPNDARCQPEYLHASYEHCARFFGGADSSTPLAYCDTWLLSPTLTPALGQKSGIRTFASDYILLHNDPESNAGRLWLFGAPLLPDQELPENTSLQRYIKALLLKGKKTGEGFGRLDWSKVRA